MDSAQYLFNEARKARVAGDFHRSATLLKRIIDENNHLADSNLALIRNSLGYSYYESGRLTEALEQYRMAESLATGSDQRSLQLRSSIHINQALYSNAIGDFSNALHLIDKAYSLLNLIPEWDEISFKKLSILLLSRGIAFYHLGRHEEALEVLKECEQVKEQHNHPYQGSVYFNLARVYQSLGEYEPSRENYLKSIERWKAEYDADYYELANIYLHFGQFLTERDQNEQGFEYLQKALYNYQQNYGLRHPLTAASYESLASYSLDQNEIPEALDYLQLALHSIVEDIDMSDPFSNPDISASQHTLTLLKILATKALTLEKASAQFTTESEKTKYLQAAIESNLLSVDVLHQIRSSYLSAESRIYLNTQQRNLFTTGIRLNLEMHRLTGRITYSEDAYLMAAKGKSQELMFEMNEKEWLYLESLPDTLALVATELKQEINHLTNLIQIASLELQPDSARLRDMQDQLLFARDTFNKQMEQLHRDFPGVGQFESTKTHFSIKEIRRNLKRKETLVEYFITGADSEYPDQLYIFAVTKRECYVYHAPLDSAFTQKLEIITHNLHAFNPYNESRERFDSLKLALHELYQDILQPVESFFKGTRLIVVPDGQLSYIPFDALISHLEVESIANYAGISYLLHDYSISYMYNSQLISHKYPRAWRFPRITAWLPGNTTSTEQSFGSLKGAEEEVQGILELAKGISIQKSLEKQELSTLLKENSILHLAMHSLATENTGKSPYFILDSVRDSLLTNRMHDYEINALNLSTPMVVLSSCETGGGLLHQGEGIMSLSRSFLQAGASSVVHSLWPVDDAKSRELMLGFYKEIKKGRSKSSALTQVKKQYLREQPPFYTHPYYWAAFQITGDVSPLHSRRSAIPITGSILVALLLLYWVYRRSFFKRA